MLSMRSLDSATVLYSNSYYTVVASIFLVSAASCKAICEVTSDYTAKSIQTVSDLFKFCIEVINTDRYLIFGQ